jgi:RNA polymerase sigma factor (sigma-70 family)
MAHENLADLSDLHLFHGWRDGDNNKGKVFYRRLAPKILRYFRRNVFDTSKVEELVQETFLEAHRSTAMEVNNPRAYLFGIAAHVISRYIRKRRREVGRPEWQAEDIEDSLHELDPQADPEYIRQQRDEDRLFMKAMRKLPFNQQLVLELSFWEEMSGREIAEALAIPEGTVRSRVRLGRERLNQLLVELQESPEQFRTATLSFDSWQRQIHDYMTGLDPDWDKDDEIST